MATEGAPFWLQFCFRGMKHVHGFLFTEQSSKLQPVICAYVYTPRLDSINDLACKRDVSFAWIVGQIAWGCFPKQQQNTWGCKTASTWQSRLEYNACDRARGSRPKEEETF
jgi:hypothetical protein